MGCLLIANIRSGSPGNKYLQEEARGSVQEAVERDVLKATAGRRLEEDVRMAGQNSTIEAKNLSKSG